MTSIAIRFEKRTNELQHTKTTLQRRSKDSKRYVLVGLSPVLQAGLSTSCLLQWEQDRQKYENAIEELQNRLANTEKAAEMAEGLQRDNTELQERANQLQFELETARRPGSGFLEQRAGSLPGSISKSLGTELAQHLREKEEEPISEGEETEEEGEAEDMSVDSFEETIIRRRKVSSVVRMFECSVPTNSDVVVPSFCFYQKRSGERAAPVELISASTQTDEIKVEHASTQSDPEEEAQAVPSDRKSVV